MTQMTCINKIRDPKGKIVSYILVGPDNQQYPCEANILKNKIFNGEVTVDNLTLTSDGRLVDAAKNKEEYNGVVGLESTQVAKHFIEKLNTEMKLIGIKSSLIKLNSVIDNEEVQLYCIKLNINNATILSTNNKSIPLRLNITSDIAIAAQFTERKAVETGQKLKDFTLIIGEIHENNLVRTELTNAIADKFNFEFDRYELNTFVGNQLTQNLAGETLKRAVNKIDLETSSLVSGAAILLVKTLGISDEYKRLIYNRNKKKVEKSLDKNTNKDFNYDMLDRVGVDTDIVRDYEDRRDKNQDSADKANNVLNEARTFKEKAQQKGIFGAFKR